MARIQIEVQAPAFTLADYAGRPVSLADYLGVKHVLLVLNRGFS